MKAASVFFSFFKNTSFSSTPYSPFVASVSAQRGAFRSLSFSPVSPFFSRVVPHGVAHSAGFLLLFLHESGLYFNGWERWSE